MEIKERRIVKKSEVEIKVYLRGGVVYSCKVRNELKAREYANSIVTSGCSKLEGKTMCYYPAHQILKVTFKVENLNEQLKINLIG